MEPPPAGRAERMGFGQGRTACDADRRIDEAHGSRGETAKDLLGLVNGRERLERPGGRPAVPCESVAIAHAGTLAGPASAARRLAHRTRPEVARREERPVARVSP